MEDKTIRFVAAMLGALLKGGMKGVSFTSPCECHVSIACKGPPIDDLHVHNPNLLPDGLMETMIDISKLPDDNDAIVVEAQKHIKGMYDALDQLKSSILPATEDEKKPTLN